MKPNEPRDLFPGALEMMVLRTLQRRAMHGYALVQHIQRTSNDLLQVEEGSLYPALHRMEQSGWIRSEWKLTDTGRKAKHYRLTAAGQKELRKAEDNFEQVVKGVRAVLRYAQG